MRFQLAKSNTQVSQKNRTLSYKKFKKKLRLGTSGLFFRKNIIFEWVYLRFLKPLIKKILKVKHSRRKTKKAWIQLKSNFPVSKKSKNSRMGKGKGSFFRWVIKLKKNTIFLELISISNFILAHFVKKINYKFINKLYFFSKLKSYPNWAATTHILFYSLRFRRKRKIKLHDRNR